MPPLPKRKYAKARQGERRSHLRATLTTLVRCSQCHSLKPSHRVCPVCGSYGGREVLNMEKAKRGKA
ncbi:MAG: 50S ribosomal protein L32 [Chloroflexi bacterium]|nr:50S ribosomal protein L32 [Chloroflexota bacterium]